MTEQDRRGPYAYVAPAPGRRPAWTTLVGILLLVIAGLALLGSLASLADPQITSGAVDGTHAVGMVIGRILGFGIFCVLPAIGGFCLLHTPRGR